MERIRGVPRHYAWGDRTTIPAFLGIEPDGEPWAELWFGTHPAAPSPLHSGGTLAEHTGDQFLLKVLAVAEPLSLQVHPDAETARRGFEEEETLGIPRDASNRVFRDPNPKPELVCAVTPFRALYGFAPASTLRRRFVAADISWIEPLCSGLEAHDDVTVNEAMRSALAMTPRAHGEVIAAVKTVEPDLYDALCEIADRYPGDPGVVLAALMNYVVLTPGEAIFVPAGTMHTYLSGTAVEAQACSDNVIRCGLTPKHVDVERFLTHLVAQETPVAIQNPDESDWTYTADSGYFKLRRLTGYVVGKVTGPGIVLTVEGTTVLASEHGAEELCPGDAVYVECGEAVRVESGVGSLTVVCALPG